MQTPSDPSYREIPLSKGQVAIVDAADYDLLNAVKWTAQWVEKKKGYYAVRDYRIGRKQHRLYMHRHILGLQEGDKRKGEHRDGNGLHNWRDNLRIATQSQNMQNTKLRRTNTSGVKGVHYVKAMGSRPWHARITANGKIILLGYFATKKEAHDAYCDAAKRFHGSFASPTPFR